MCPVVTVIYKAVLSMIYPGQAGGTVAAPLLSRCHIVAGPFDRGRICAVAGSPSQSWRPSIMALVPSSNILRGGYAARSRAPVARGVFRAWRRADCGEKFGPAALPIGGARSMLALMGDRAGRGGRETAPPTISGTYPGASHVVGMAMWERMGQGADIVRKNMGGLQVAQLRGHADALDRAQLGTAGGAQIAGGAFPLPARALHPMPLAHGQHRFRKTKGPAGPDIVNAHAPADHRETQRHRQGSGAGIIAARDALAADRAAFGLQDRGRGVPGGHVSLDAGKSRTLRHAGRRCQRVAITVPAPGSEYPGGASGTARKAPSAAVLAAASRCTARAPFSEGAAASGRRPRCPGRAA